MTGKFEAGPAIAWLGQSGILSVKCLRLINLCIVGPVRKGA